MRATAQVKRPTKQIIVQPVALPAPVSGWDAISPAANMPVDRAVQIDNWVCKPGWIEPRKGYVPQSSQGGCGGSSTPVQTVMSYNGNNGQRSLFGVAGGTIYDVTTIGSAVPDVTGLQSSRLQYVIFSNPATSQFLVTVNGADDPWVYDGVSWSQPAITIGYAGGSITWQVNPINNESIDLNGQQVFFAQGTPVSLIFSANPSAGQTIDMDGTVITFVNGTPATNQVEIGSALNETILNLWGFLVSSTDPNIIKFGFFLQESLKIIVCTYLQGGVYGTDFTLTSNCCTISTTNDFIITIGATLADTLANLLTFLQASPNVDLTQFTYSTSLGTTLNLVAQVQGVNGNSLTLSAGYATGEIVFPANPSNGDTINLDGTTVEFVNSDPTGDEVKIGATLAITLQSLLAFLNGAIDAGIQNFTYSIGPIQDKLLLQASTAGVLGNALPIAASAAYASGPTLQGGSTAATSGTTLQGGGQDYGIQSSQFIQVNSYMNRLWFVPINSTNVVYLQTVGGISGPASVFPLGQLMKKGGYIMAIGTWTVDTRQNVDEYIAFISSRGEVIVYQGTDPTTASTFALTGMYQIGAPIGRRCFLRISGDLQIICIDGVVGMSEMLSTDRAAANRVSLTSIIMNQMALAAQSYKNNFGWQIIEVPISTLAILNIPVQENAQQIQYVMNTITGAWSRFIGLDATGAQNASYGINANCWEVDAFDNVYFGGNDGTVYQWNVGSGDNGKPITCVVNTAYNNFGNGAQLKRYTMLQPLITTTGTPIPAIGVNVDFNTTNTLSTATPILGSVPLWDQVLWDTFNWPGGPETTDTWTSVQGIGHYVSIVTQISTVPSVSNPTLVTDLQLNGWNIVAESGAFV